MSTDQLIDLEVEAGIARITINRPEKLNAMTVEMDRQLNTITAEINTRDDIRVTILGGAGDRAFSVGSDINDLGNYGSSWQYRNRFDRNLDYAIAVWKMRKPVIAAIDGYCLGGGLEMACASDIRVATRSSTFAAAEIKWGWHGGSGATQFLTRIVGPGYASELLLTGERIDAERAYRMRLISDIFETNEAMLDRAQHLAALIAARAPIPVEAVKRLVRVAQSSSIEVGLAYENDLFTYEMSTADAAEGRSAFAQKRTPTFVGR